MKARSLEKHRDKNGIILGYTLQDTKGNLRQFSSNQLKQLIRLKKVEVVNLTLTSDNRLVDTSQDIPPVKREAPQIKKETPPVEVITKNIQVVPKKKKQFIKSPIFTYDGHKMQYILRRLEPDEVKSEHKKYIQAGKNLYYEKHILLKADGTKEGYSRLRPMHADIFRDYLSPRDDDTLSKLWIDVMDGEKTLLDYYHTFFDSDSKVMIIDNNHYINRVNSSIYLKGSNMTLEDVFEVDFDIYIPKLNTLLSSVMDISDLKQMIRTEDRELVLIKLNSLNEVDYPGTIMDIDYVIQSTNIDQMIKIIEMFNQKYNLRELTNLQVVQIKSNALLIFNYNDYEKYKNIIQDP